MFLHLGQDTVIIEDDIIGIFDLDTTTVSKPTRDYLKTMQKGENVINVSYDLPKSFVITCKKNSKKKTMYISPISTATLLKRSENVNNLKDIK